MHIKNPMEWLFAQMDVTAGFGAAHPTEYWPATHSAAAPIVQKINNEDLRQAVRRGLHDFSAARTDIIFFFMVYPAIALFFAAADAKGVLPLLFPVASGFALLGPFLAIGLYEMSRDREMTGNISWADIFKVFSSPSIVSILFLGALMIGLFLVWLSTARGIYDLTLGPEPPVSTLGFLTAVFTTLPGYLMIIIGTIVGAVFAVLALAISVVSFPLLLDRPVGFGTAIATSLVAVQHNPGPLALWGLFVVGTLILGALPCFIGLVVVLPVLGHSTWHLYRAIVQPPAKRV